jgi:hypothetical protein
MAVDWQPTPGERIMGKQILSKLKALANEASFRVTIASLDKGDSSDEPLVLKVTVGGDFESKLSLEVELLDK